MILRRLKLTREEAINYIVDFYDGLNHATCLAVLQGYVLREYENATNKDLAAKIRDIKNSYDEDVVVEVTW